MNPNGASNNANPKLPNVPAAAPTPLGQQSLTPPPVLPGTQPAAPGTQSPNNAAGQGTDANNPVYLARTIVLNNYSDPWQMTEQFWVLKKQLLEQKYGIHIN